jgi:hypothetical protein
MAATNNVELLPGEICPDCGGRFARDLKGIGYRRHWEARQKLGARGEIILDEDGQPVICGGTADSWDKGNRDQRMAFSALLARQILLAQIVTNMSATNGQYTSLLTPNPNTYSLPYWGDPSTAQIATFGVNPSAKEFVAGRWPNALTIAQLDDRCVRYFVNSVPPHAWFSGYEKALNILGHSYREDSLHLDLSPRATRAMRAVNGPLFRQMIAADMTWFLSVLALSSSVKGAIMCGSVTNRFYFDEFLCKHLPSNYRLKPRTPRSGRGSTAIYDFSGPGFAMPVLFCGTSPSGDGGVRIVNEVRTLLPQLRAAGF